MEDWEWCGVTLSASTKPRGHELGSSDRLGIREPFCNRESSARQGFGSNLLGYSVRFNYFIEQMSINR